MSVLTTQQETGDLLAHYALDAVMDNPTGGHVCGFEGLSNAENHKSLAIVAGVHRQIRECPISRDQAHAMVAELVQAGALPKDASFGNLVEHLILAFSTMYVDSGIDSFHFPSVHMHPTSYEIAKGQIWRTQPLHLTPRRKHNEHVAHSGHPHVPSQKH
ncbi:MAG: hypothetical protein M3N19_07715 [Candidatus Eremiobacteraeota bacterium]|nr:hypothetical protein [Candidatus Eremiobacteraeota bacterium]